MDTHLVLVFIVVLDGLKHLQNMCGKHSSSSFGVTQHYCKYEIDGKVYDLQLLINDQDLCLTGISELMPFFKSKNMCAFCNI